MQERASSMRVRDYLNHVEAKVSDGSVVVEDMLLKENLRQLNDIEAYVNDDTWTVTTKLDTIMLKQWLRDASVYQAYQNPFD